MTEKEERDVERANLILERRRRESSWHDGAQRIDRIEDIIQKVFSSSISARKTNPEFARYVSSLKDESKRFCAFPGAIITLSEFHQLSRRALRTLIGLHYYRDRYSNRSRPGFKTLMRDFNESPKYFQRGIKELKEKGFVLQIEKSSHGRANEYLLAVNARQVEEIRMWNQEHSLYT